MDQIHRENEQGEIPNRSDRFYLLESKWFFTTREASAVGPFETREEASSGLSNYIDFLTLAKPKIKKRFVESMSS